MKKRFGKILSIALCLVLISGVASTAMASTTYTSSTGGESAITVSGTTKTYDDIIVKKTGSTNSGNADFNGTNAAVLAKKKGSLTITDSTISTSGKHANGVFSYGSYLVVN